MAVLVVTFLMYLLIGKTTLFAHTYMRMDAANSKDALSRTPITRLFTRYTATFRRVKREKYAEGKIFWSFFI